MCTHTHTQNNKHLDYIVSIIPGLFLNVPGVRTGRVEKVTGLNSPFVLPALSPQRIGLTFVALLTRHQFDCLP